MGYMLGFMLALYFLVGRWSFDRLEASGGSDLIYEQPRLWIIIGLVPLALLLQLRTPSHGLRGRPTSVDIAICGFLGYMILTAFWAINSALAFEKGCELSLMLVVAIVIAISRPAQVDQDMQHGFWWTIVLIGVAMAGLALCYSTGGRLYVPGGGPNTLGRNMGLTALGATYLAGKSLLTARSASAAVVIMAMLLVLLCGSRGALLSSSVGAFVLLVTAREALVKKIAAICGLAMLGAATLLSTDIGQNALQLFYDRIFYQTFEKQHLAGREDLWFDAVNWTMESPWFGWGLNDYRDRQGIYPHNIFLEVAVEGGIFGLLMLAYACFTCCRQLWRNRSRLSQSTLAALALTATAAQTSGDLFDSRGVFLMAALATPSVMQPVRSVRRRVGSARCVDRAAGRRARLFHRKQT